mgnify:CR=1 FL=1
MTYHIDYAYTCHAGKVRPNNEDNFWCCGEHLPVSNHGTEEIRTGLRLRESLPVMAVFDGMGGESYGEMAAYGREQRISAMGTTMAMLAFGKKEAYICNLGDSRIYRFSKGEFSQISRDHVLKSCRFGKAPLTQFLGVEETEMKLEPAIAAVPYQDRDRYLLCSDGVTDMLSDREIEEIMKQEDSVRDIAHTLLTRVLDKGARDNTTIILCEVRADNWPLKTWFLQKKG